MLTQSLLGSPSLAGCEPLINAKLAIERQSIDGSKVKANEMEADLSHQGQSLADQFPMDMETVKLELETELRVCGDEARAGLKTAQNEKHSQQLGDSLMSELQIQAANHKSDVHSLSLIHI